MSIEFRTSELISNAWYNNIIKIIVDFIEIHAVIRNDRKR